MNPEKPISKDANPLTYEQFLSKYEQLLTLFLSYNPDQIGSGHYAAELADLVDSFPEFEARYDLEQNERFATLNK